jgi:putative ABC transport system permease protein
LSGGGPAGNFYIVETTETMRTHTLPVLPAALLRRLLHAAERDEVMADFAAEYAARAARGGGMRARLWLWRQVAGSVPWVARRSWHGGTTGFESEANRMRSGGVVESWIMDARFAVRRLWTRPQYTALAVLTLALGIGGTTAVFGIARAVLVEPLPYERPEELVMFWNVFDWSEAELTHLRPDWAGFAGVAGYTTEGVFLRREGSAPRLVPGIRASAELFDVLGARPQLGRGFRAGDDDVGAEPAAVLSHGLWQELGGRADVVGSVVQMDGVGRRVLGVMPAGFWFPDPSVRVWLTTPMRADNRSGNYALVGRLQPGRDVAAMADPLNRITTRLREEFTYPAEWDKTRNAELTRLGDHLVGPVRPALLATLAGMGVILLMACANVATLMLGQLRGRTSELAVRAALGAGRRRITQQLLIEAGALGLLAGVVGALAALAAFRLLLAALPLGELAAAVRADWTLFAVALLIALGASLLIALAPVFSLWRGDLRDALSRARSGGIDAHGGRLEDVLVVAEVALAVLLAASAAVLIRSVENLRAIDSGVETANAAVIDVTASSDLTGALRRQQLTDMIGALEALPGVRDVGMVQRLPLRDRGDNWGISIQSRPELESSTTAMRIVSRDYFAALGIELRSGRLFDGSDRFDSEPVIVIDENLAAQYFPDVDPIGQYIASGLGEGWMRVVGVVENVAVAGLTEEPVPARYVLYEQFGYTPEAMSLVLRLDNGRGTETVVQQAVRTIESAATSYAVHDATTMDAVLAMAMGPTRRIMQLMTLLGLLALTLGAVGVYGVVSHFVNRRRRDWVIRITLGMHPLAVVRQVAARGALLVTAGCAAGIAASLVLTRLFTSLLYGVSPADPTALLGAAATLIAAGCLAALLPAARASRANPASVLRES